MRQLVVCWVLLSVPALSARASSVRLITESFALEPAWQLSAAPAPRLALTAPCLGCRLPMFTAEPAALSALASAATTGVVRSRVATRPVSSSAPSRSRPIAIGDSWRLAGGREFSIHLTPTQEECAPLMRLTF